jgi:hypothetical protein
LLGKRLEEHHAPGRAVSPLPFTSRDDLSRHLSLFPTEMSGNNSLRETSRAHERCTRFATSDREFAKRLSGWYLSLPRDSIMTVHRDATA